MDENTPWDQGDFMVEFIKKTPQNLIFRMKKTWNWPSNKMGISVSKKSMHLMGYPSRIDV
jgi:hypothetical protein